MRVQILGCSGGIGGSTQRTTSLLVDHDILIDAGPALPICRYRRWRKSIMYLSPTLTSIILPVCHSFSTALMQCAAMYAARETQEIIRTHIFNWSIWPDFSQIPDEKNPYLRFYTITLGEPVVLGGRSITGQPHRAGGRLSPRQRYSQPGVFRQHHRL